MSAGVVAASQIVLISNIFRANLKTVWNIYLKASLRIDSLQTLLFPPQHKSQKWKVLKWECTKLRIKTKSFKTTKQTVKKTQYSIATNGFDNRFPQILMTTSNFFYYKSNTHNCNCNELTYSVRTKTQVMITHAVCKQVNQTNQLLEIVKTFHWTGTRYLMLASYHFRWEKHVLATSIQRSNKVRAGRTWREDDRAGFTGNVTWTEAFRRRLWRCSCMT